MVLGFSRLVAGEKKWDRVKEVGTQPCAAKGKKEKFLRCVPERRENELRDGRKGNWKSVDCEGSGATQAEMSNKQLPIGPLLEGKTELKVKSWIPYSFESQALEENKSAKVNSQTQWKKGSRRVLEGERSSWGLTRVKGLTNESQVGWREASREKSQNSWELGSRSRRPNQSSDGVGTEKRPLNTESRAFPPTRVQ